MDSSGAFFFFAIPVQVFCTLINRFRDLDTGKDRGASASSRCERTPETGETPMLPESRIARVNRNATPETGETPMLPPEHDSIVANAGNRVLGRQGQS